MFKAGDFVKVKPNTALKTGDIVNDWVGKVEEVFPQKKMCLLTLDAQTINNLDDDYLMGCIEEEIKPYEYVFYLDELELAKRRDTNQQAEQALAKVSARINVLEGGRKENLEELQERWIEEFVDSTYYEGLNEFQKDDVGFVIGTFMNYMDRYEGLHPKEWDNDGVEAICLEIVPRKVSAEIETFENYGVILPQFFEFLGNKGYISNADSLVKTMKGIKDEIVIQSQNSNNWGIAKSMMASAQAQGFDLSNQEERQQFMALQQLAALKKAKETKSRKFVAKQEDPFKAIGRNQKITIRYKDGRIVENIKFKKVALALKSGTCEIIDK